MTITHTTHETAWRTLPVKSVLDFTADITMERDYWQRSPAMTGVFLWNELDSVAAVRGWLDRAVETQTSLGNLNYASIDRYPNGHAPTLTPTGVLPSGFGYNLLLSHERNPNERYLAAAERQLEALLACPRTSDGGFWSRLEGPELWIDMTYFICPFLVRMGQVTARPELVDEAYKQFLLHAKRLVDPIENLGRHAWLEVPNSFPQPTFWSRGNGWLIATGFILSDAAPDHESARDVLDIVLRVVRAIRGHQDRSGFVRHVIDDPTSEFESSGTCAYAYGAARAATAGLLDDSFLDSAKRAVDVVTGGIGPDGGVTGVSVPPGGPGVPFGTGPLGQGFYLMATHALKDQPDVQVDLSTART